MMFRSRKDQDCFADKDVVRSCRASTGCVVDARNSIVRGKRRSGGAPRVAVVGRGVASRHLVCRVSSRHFGKNITLRAPRSAGNEYLAGRNLTDLSRACCCVFARNIDIMYSRNDEGQSARARAIAHPIRATCRVCIIQRVCCVSREISIENRKKILLYFRREIRARGWRGTWVGTHVVLARNRECNAILMLPTMRRRRRRKTAGKTLATRRSVDRGKEDGRNRLAAESVADKIRSPANYPLPLRPPCTLVRAAALRTSGSIGEEGGEHSPLSAPRLPVRLSRRKFGITPENAAGVHSEYNITPAAESFSPTPTNRHLTSRVSQKRAAPEAVCESLAGRDFRVALPFEVVPFQQPASFGPAPRKVHPDVCRRCRSINEPAYGYLRRITFPSLACIGCTVR